MNALHIKAAKCYKGVQRLCFLVAHRKSSLWIDIYHSFNEFLRSGRDIAGDIEPASLDLFQKNPKIVIIKWK